ncbi:unnamed protein product [Paramecium primaurelia]|uniref:Uncharacterized protein n=2 Tax=Paramecium TaxID=5884 RepID=A0A8S1WDI5_9CILI|nr:unnamed protein product [Paramecium primaurelia]CAD8183966.1 unnamed protein product [Paramecium pentaurelia]
MNQIPQSQFQFIKTYFLKSSIAKQIIPDSLDDIHPEILDGHSTNNSQHRRIKSDVVQKKEAQKLRLIQQQYSQQTDTSTQNQSFISQGILKNKSQRSISNKGQIKKSHKKKVHFI